ncbi:LysM peptidoglycan-binding domain-containing protein [Corallococcus exercitus]|uniref:LysM peptidoglycan-binding domain-containing protein n=1 Tax=Corallococcus exercitus TaxID=2316736 RepID=UPI000EA0C3C0|nr:LysM peptidoglycan-binding domain-containing protein [Corallococcus exercitus]RKG79469.1 LysM peptidoglycan-binding domain-containing protein [Corallococcus exercitus]
MRSSLLILLLCAGCAARVVTPVPAPAPAPAQAASAMPPVETPAATPPAQAAAPAPGAPQQATPPVSASGAPAAMPSPAEVAAVVTDAAVRENPCPVEPEEEDDEATAATDDEGVSEEGEMQAPLAPAAPAGPLYTADLSDEALTEAWKKDPSTLGSMSIGFVESGRQLNSVRVPDDKDWLVVSPEIAYGTQETVDYVVAAIRAVRAQYPNVPPLRVNRLSTKDGGYLRPHKSHQNGRDVDLGFYYPTAEPVRERERERYIDVAMNWALVRSLVVNTDVQMILVDKRVQKVLYDYALSIGEDKAWLDSLFNAGFNSLIKHARRHRDHFHVRFFNGRAQELGRRVAPLLALQPDQNLMMYKVRNGDTLGGIAMRHNSSVVAIKKANRMRNTFLSIGRRLVIPLKGPCTHCPIPPPVQLPPRRMPPQTQAPALVNTAPAASGKLPNPCTPAAPAPTPVAVPTGVPSGLSTAR